MRVKVIILTQARVPIHQQPAGHWPKDSVENN